MTHYDLIIIGSGSGNTLVTEDWDSKKVAIIDGGTFGGTCLNVGCIPTKMYVFPAELAHSTVKAADLGVDARVDAVHWPKIRDRVFGRIDAISEAGRNYRDVELDNVDLYQEHARFTGERTLVTDSGAELEGGQIVIAAGSRPVLPDVPGMDLPQVHTSDTVMRIEELPGRILIVGGGYVAAEFAHIFDSFGSEVVQINRSGQLLKHTDRDVSEGYTRQAQQQWDLRLNRVPGSVTELPDGRVAAALVDGDGADAGTVQADIVLVATGRRPNADTLDVHRAGFDVTGDGRVVVDDYQRVVAAGSAVDGVWSLGDVSSEYQLKHVANHEARVVSHNLVHPDDLRFGDHRYVPAAIFTRPQIASVGLTEEEARRWAARNGTEVCMQLQAYGSTAYGWAMEDDDGFVKLLAEKGTGKLLGAHIMGHEASMIVQPLIQAMSFGLDAHTMARGQYWIHPALPEVVENALLGLDV
ncbi:mycothione reductase [Arthrobacter castelli]|uniref:mycothione reductase n=1 Tax=Arthrobacter castelli TaxID=271431 RepID=UPI000412620C|nr:mycothione reductase [Arthrobacter castelli]